mgnify:CR=1 FL=1
MAARVEARQAEWAQRAAEIAHEAVPAHPSITNHAASLERHGEQGLGDVAVLCALRAQLFQGAHPSIEPLQARL